MKSGVMTDYLDLRYVFTGTLNIPSDCISVHSVLSSLLLKIILYSTYVYVFTLYFTIAKVNIYLR